MRYLVAVLFVATLATLSFGTPLQQGNLFGNGIRIGSSNETHPCAGSSSDTAELKFHDSALVVCKNGTAHFVSTRAEGESPTNVEDLQAENERLRNALEVTSRVYCGGHGYYDVDNAECVCDASPADGYYAGEKCGECLVGWEEDGNNECKVNIDECALQTHDCVGGNASCVDTPGSYECRCNERFAGDGFTCVQCPPGTENSDTYPSTCLPCPPRFAGSDGSCAECPSTHIPSPGKDECVRCDDGTTPNSEQNACELCPAGSVGIGGACPFECSDLCESSSCNVVSSDDRAQCVDVNECTEQTHNCSALATCENSFGGFSCSCNDGHEGDGTTCTPVQCPALSAAGGEMLSCSSSSHEYLSSCWASCESGYVSSGSSVRYCQADGTWSGTPHTCESTPLWHGTGADGDLHLTAATPTVTLDAPSTYLSSTASSGATQINVASTTNFAIGDELLIVQVQGGQSDVGHYELGTIASVDSSTQLTLSSSLSRTYVDGSQDSTSSSTVQVVKVPNYESVVVEQGVTLSPQAWNGYTGGILAFKCRGLLNVSGTISASGMGFRGGSTSSSGQSGESWNGKGSTSQSNNNGAGGGGLVNVPGTHSQSGGGGGAGASDGRGGAGSSTRSSGGNGRAGIGGVAYGGSDLESVLLFGSGGGGGSYDYSTQGRNGGRGGGIFFAVARDVVLAVDALQVSGAISESGPGTASNGGSGGGGSLYLRSTGSLTVGGGAGSHLLAEGGVATGGGNSAGGAGGGGRIMYSGVIGLPTPASSPSAVETTHNGDANAGTGGEPITCPGTVDGTSGLCLDCPAGYNAVDGGDCEDIDECYDDSHTCDDKATCENTGGSFECSCNPGYTGDGQTCVEESCPPFPVAISPSAVVSCSDGSDGSANVSLGVSCTQYCFTDENQTMSLDTAGTTVHCQYLTPEAESHPDWSATSGSFTPVNTGDLDCNVPAYSGSSLGSGSDGAWVPSSSTTWDVVASALSSSVSAGATSASVESTAGFEVGDEVMLLQTQHSNANNHGRYSMNTISQIDGSTLHFTNALDTSFDSGTFSSSSSVVAQVIRVYHFSSVNIPENVTVDLQPWDGHSGGVAVLRVRNAVHIGGELRAAGAGFRGGSTASSAYAGESWYGTPGVQRDEYHGAGGGGLINVPGQRSQSGGGGGGHASDGSGGAQSNPSVRSGGNGGRGGDGGIAFGRSDLNSYLSFGGGGGGGSYDYSTVGRDGGRGGGIIMVLTHTTHIGPSGSVSVSGTEGDNGPGTVSYGGSGAGGTLSWKSHSGQSTSLFSSQFDTAGGEMRVNGDATGGQGGDARTWLV